MKGRFLLLAAGPLLLAACNADKLQVPNRNSPNPEAIDPVAAVNLEVPGILFQARANHVDRVRDFMILGREGFYYFPTDNRWTSGFLEPTNGRLNPASAFGRGSGLFSGGYRQMRNIYTLLKVVEAAPEASISLEQKAGIRGWANTFGALEMHYLLESRDELGAVTEMVDDPTAVRPFVSRDSAYAWASNMLDSAAADLDRAGTTAFLFAPRLTANTGLNGFRTPAEFRRFNRAIAARVWAYRGSLGCGASCYQEALDALAESFVPTTAAGLSTGLYFVFSTTAGDQQNVMSRDNNTDRVAHPSIKTVETKPGGAPDNRYAAKIVTIPVTRPAGTDWAQIGIETDVGFTVYPTRTSPMPIIRGEELILLRAEARWFTGDKLGAIQDIDFIRTNSGGLAASTLTVASSDDQFVTELLAQRRLSLLLEAHRWPDFRRFDRLDLLPVDLPTHFVAVNQPIPQEECDYRRDKGPELQGPECQ